VDFEHLDNCLLIEELDKLVVELDTMVRWQNFIGLVVVKGIIVLMAIIEYLMERLEEHKFKLAVKQYIEKGQHIIMEHIKVSVIGAQECKIVAIDVELELYKFIQAIEVVEQLEDIIMEQLELNKKMCLLEFMKSKRLEEYIVSVMQIIIKFILQDKVENTAVKEANIKFMVASKSMANIVVFVKASKFS
jgi:hypothetical protein